MPPRLDKRWRTCDQKPGAVLWAADGWFLDFFLEDAPNYPEDFYPTLDGTRRLKVKNQFLLAELRSVEAGEGRKVYQDGYSRGELVSVHYFESRSGRVFDVKVKSGWSDSARMTTTSIPTSLKLVDRAEVEPWVAVMSLGLCAAIVANSLSIAEAEVALFNPGVLAQLEALGVGQELRDMVHLGTELEDVESLAPERLGESVAEIQALALEFLRGLGRRDSASRDEVVRTL